MLLAWGSDTLLPGRAWRLAFVREAKADVSAPLPRFVAHGTIRGIRDKGVRMADAGLIKRFYEEVIIGGNLSLVDELTAEDLVDHEEGLPGQPSGREGVKFFVNAMRQAFPDLRLKTIDPTMADGDLEAARTILSGTHNGEFMGIPASGSTVEFESIDIIRLSDGKVAEHWGVTDVLTRMQQIGAVPS